MEKELERDWEENNRKWVQQTRETRKEDPGSEVNVTGECEVLFSQPGSYLIPDHRKVPRHNLPT